MRRRESSRCLRDLTFFLGGGVGHRFPVQRHLWERLSVLFRIDLLGELLGLAHWAWAKRLALGRTLLLLHLASLSGVNFLIQFSTRVL